MKNFILFFIMSIMFTSLLHAQKEMNPVAREFVNSELVQQDTTFELNLEDAILFDLTQLQLKLYCKDYFAAPRIKREKVEWFQEANLQFRLIIWYVSVANPKRILKLTSTNEKVNLFID